MVKSHFQSSILLRDQPSAEDSKRFETAVKQWHLSFMRSPTEILVNSDKRVCGVRMEKNELKSVRR